MLYLVYFCVGKSDETFRQIVRYYYMENITDIECHPWPPFIPPRTKVLIMGTFPPQQKRWSMDFYYPNRTNDFWYMMGLLFFGDRRALLLPGSRDFDLSAIMQLLDDRGIAMNDTVRRARRLKDNASDKYLDIVEPVPLDELLSLMPSCHHVATTGEKAASVVASLTDTAVPAMGCQEYDPQRRLHIWRMPSTSRAYPLRLEAKADFYRRLFEAAGVL